MAFRLARVLRVRSQLREQAQDALIRARAELAAIAERMQALHAAELHARATASEVATAGCTAEDLVRFEVYAARLVALRERLKGDSARIQDEVRVRREALLMRRREERQLEKLAERAAERETSAEEHATALLLDDLARRKRTVGKGMGS